MKIFQSSKRKDQKQSLVIYLLIFALLTLPLIYPHELCAEESEVEASGALQGGRVIVGITQEPDFFDPHLAVAAGTKEILFNIFQGLTAMTPEGEYQPCLAESWEVEDEGKTYRFKLREDVYFHNGEKMSAEDVLYSLERAAGLGENEALMPELAMIKAVEISEDETEVVIELKESTPDLPAFLTVAIIPQAYEEQNEHPIGTGPFRFKEYIPQVSVELERFEEYWQEDLPYLDEVSFRIYGDMDAAYLELLAGEIDIFPYLTEEKLQGLEDKYEVVAGGINMIQVLALNNEAEPLFDPLVREAINLAIDREQVREMIMGEYGQEIVSAMAPSMGKFYNEELAKDALSADQEAAKAKLAEAGLKDGFTLKISVPANYLIHVDTANLLAAQLAEVGITAVIDPVDWGTWLEKIYTEREYEATVIALTYDFYTPVDVMNRFMTDSPDNFINYVDMEYDLLALKAEKELNESNRINLYHRMQEILWEDKVSIFLQEPFNITVVRKPLAGYRQYPAYVQDMASVYYTDQAELDASAFEY